MKIIVPILLFFLFSLTAQAQSSRPLEFFGANGTDAVADDAAIDNALESIYDTIYGLTGHTYYLNSRHTKIRKSGKVFDGRGAKIYFMPTMPQTTSVGLFEYSAASVSYSVSVAVNKGARKFSTNQTDKFTVGQIIQLKGPIYSMHISGGDQYNHGWYSVVTAISGNEVTMQDAALTSFTASNLTVYEKIQNLHFLNWEVDGTTRTGGTVFVMRNVLNSSIKNNHIYGKPDVQNNTGSLFSGIRIQGVNINISENHIHDGILASGNAAYAINPYGQNVWVENNFIENWSSSIVGVNVSFQTGTITVKGNTLNRGKGRGTAINFHGAGGGIIKGNTINGTRASFRQIEVRFDNTIVEDNVFNIDGTNYTGTGWPTMENYMNLINIIENGNNHIVVRNNRSVPTNLPYGFDLKEVTFGYSHVQDTAKPVKLHPPRNNIIITNNDFGRVHFGTASYARIGPNIQIRNNYLKQKGFGVPTEVYINTDEAGTFTYDISSNVQVIDSNALKTSTGTTSTIPIRVRKTTTSGFANNNTQYRLSGRYTGTLISLAASGTQSGNLNQSGTNPPTFPVIPTYPIPPPSAPGAPVLVSALFNKVTIDIPPSDWAVAYKVYRAISLTGHYFEISTGTVQPNAFVDYTVQPGQKYFYKAVAVNETGQSVRGPASVQINTPTATPPPAPPTPLIAGVTNNTVTITIQSVAGAESYNLLQSATQTGTYTTVATGLLPGNYQRTGLASGTTYFFRTAGVNGAGTGPTSGEVSATTTTTVLLPATPAAPTFSGIAYNYIDVVVPVSANSTSYTISRSLTPDGPFVDIAVGLPAGTFRDTEVEPVTTYYYRVKGVNANGESAYSVSSSATTLAPPSASFRVMTRSGKILTQDGKVITTTTTPQL